MNLFNRMVHTFSKQTKPWIVYLSISGILLLSSAELADRDNELFQRFMGTLDPVLAILMSSLLGLLVLSHFSLKGWFSIYRRMSLRTIILYSSLVLFFACISILVDLNAPFSSDINIPFPQSILFYPAIAFVVEIVFHLVPLWLLLYFTMLFSNKSFERLLWPCLVVIAMLEPIYQLLFMKTFPAWAMIVIGFNLFLFNLIQLLIFKKHGFISMYVSRLVFYVFWHLVWGYFRLELLF